jgi:exodeoxyribonuclease V gamma subunit
MAIKLQVSNSLNSLAQQFCADLKQQEISVFQPYYLVTQTEGMNNWLKIQMSNRLGIAANYRFLKPNDVINQIYQILGGQFTQTLDAENQSWLLFNILNETEFKKRFPSVALYYADEYPDQDLKRLALAQKIADLFDQYQIYRPQIIQDWNQEKATNSQQEKWQQYLWNKAKNLAKLELPDKTIIGEFILTALKNPASIAKLKMQMPAIYLFGLSVLTDYHIQLFHQLGQHIQFNYYFLNPSPSVYWVEDVSRKRAAKIAQANPNEDTYISLGNNLLTSWGKVIQNTFWLLFKNEDLLNSYDVIENQENRTKTLLHLIQTEIHQNQTDEERIKIDNALLNDGSITISNCFTPAREVEALYNYLVALVNERKEALSPRDIVVMVSDIDTYSPYIKAVFNNAPYSFNFTIADESYSSNDTIAAALIAILELNEQNLTAETVLQLLDFSYIRNRFALSDLTLLRKVVNAANIRFGATGLTEDESIYVSWEYGLERIKLGICISGSEEYFTNNYSLYPVDMVEGNAAQEIIKFVHFVEVLLSTVANRKADRSLVNWVNYVEDVLRNLIFDPLENVDEDYQIIIKQLEKHNALHNYLTQDITYQLFTYSFVKTISGATRANTFASGGITFCSLIPMRSIPFKVVALLGLNFDKFPRKEVAVDFDLIKHSPKPGDRNIKENDKHLFLETLLSARDYFYISYIGQNVKDNSALPPSALVDEFLDYIQTKTEADDIHKVLVKKHPLHHFSPKSSAHFKINYLANHQAKNYSFIDDDIKADTQEFNQITIAQFINFFKDPIKTYFNSVLNIYYQSEEMLLSETEIFGLDKLQEWSIKNILLHHDDSSIQTLRDKWVKTGSLPLKNVADLTLKNINESVQPIKQLFQNCIGDNYEEIENIHLSIPNLNIEITGSINQIYNQQIVVVSWSKNENKYLLEGYLKYLLANAAGIELKFAFISSVKEKIYISKTISQEDALNQLNTLVKIFLRGKQKTLCFYPDLNIKIQAIPYCTYVDFSKAIDKKFNTFNYPSTDIYGLIKYREGFFNNEAAFTQYQFIGEHVLSAIDKILPTYFE